VIESNYTSRCVTKRGLNATSLADSTFDIESIVFNETVIRIVQNIRDRIPIIGCNIGVMFQPNFISDIFLNIVESINKEELYNCVRNRVESEESTLDSKAKQIFLARDFEEFSNWLGYRSTVYTLYKHVTKVCSKNIGILFQPRNEIKEKQL
jgi:hypothetical protein